MQRMFRKVLVANRGEIALRVFRAAASSASRPSRSPRPTTPARCTRARADEMVEIASYLDAEEHIRAAREAGADAIHPGYGFLAENGDFAEAVAGRGPRWVGPPPAALRAGGDKLAAKRHRARPRACRRSRRRAGEPAR